jgi:hypothetical protein
MVAISASKSSATAISIHCTANAHHLTTKITYYDWTSFLTFFLKTEVWKRRSASGFTALNVVTAISIRQMAIN